MSHLIFIRYCALTSFVVSLFVETQTAAVFCAGGAIRGLFDHRFGSWADFVEVSLQDPLVQESLIRRHTLGWIPAIGTIK